MTDAYNAASLALIALLVTLTVSAVAYVAALAWPEIRRELSMRRFERALGRAAGWPR